ncbi:MAG: hypothetical protein JWM28_1897 [Chitinophagaceae bacterium]|nr:hypothetical protein [Chitinophagaceae bacterium]
MRKLSLTIIFYFFYLFSSFAQMNSSDTSGYKQRKLKIEEVNFVSGYYLQNGSNSAVTGGIGTEKLSDFANTLDVVLLKTDKHNRQFTWAAEFGIDNYTSASSDNIDPTTVSGPSSHDTRTYFSAGWSEKDAKNNKFGITGAFSTEFDYKSIGLGANYSRTSADNNREFALSVQSYFDRWTVIYPVELRPPGGAFSGHSGDYQPRNSYSASLSWSQVVNKRLQLAVLMDVVSQMGLLATDYQRVFFNDNSVRIEVLPASRYKLPMGIRANYFIDDRFIVRSYYRYYMDDWGVRAHTASLELPVKLNAFLSISPFYRFNQQSAAKYFAAYGLHATTDMFYTSDFDLSAFHSSFFGTGVRFSPEKGVLKIKNWSSLEIRYGHYIRSTGLHSDILTFYAFFK